MSFCRLYNNWSESNEEKINKQINMELYASHYYNAMYAYFLSDSVGFPKVAEYFNIRFNDMVSVRRSRIVARPRQVAMALSKELTTHSLPEIGDAFGGRDHTTVIHACRKISELKNKNIRGPLGVR